MRKLWMKIATLTLVALLLVGSVTFVSGCEEDTTVENVAEEAGEAVEEAGEEAQDAAEDAADAIDR